MSIHFHAGPIPSGYRLEYEPYLFNRAEHRALQSREGWQEFHLLKKSSRKVLASAYFHIENNRAQSPLRAPFGGFDTSKPISFELIYPFITAIEQSLISKGVTSIEIGCPPELYSAAQPFITTTLINHGFQTIQAESGACICIDKTPLREKMSKDKRARLSQCEKKGLRFRKLDIKKLESVYSFIASCRAKQGRQLSMPYADLQKTVQQFPQYFFLVGVFDKTKMIGACICIQVTRSIVYTFYSAHDDAYDKISPRVFLLHHLYKVCRRNKVSMLDLGTSMLHNQPNFPLLDFKLRVGATLTPKFRFRKTLA